MQKKFDIHGTSNQTYKFEESLKVEAVLDAAHFVRRHPHETPLNRAWQEIAQTDYECSHTVFKLVPVEVIDEGVVTHYAIMLVKKLLIDNFN